MKLRRTPILLSPLVFLALACGAPSGGGGRLDAGRDGGVLADAGSESDAGLVDDGGTGGTGADAGSGVDAGTSTDAGMGGDAGTTGDAGSGPTPVRFFLLGDTGTGSQAQYDVASQMEAICARDGCDFAVLLGDNIYDSGVSSVDDPQWQTKFEDPYAGLDIPFYAVLGNHDYGGKGTGNEFDKGPIEVAYSQVSQKWTMPDTHYTFTWGNVGFIALDTNSILWGNTQHGDQAAWYPTALTEVAGSEWILLLGHHPYRSDGKHGNAGTYEGIPGIPILSGGKVKDFFDTVVCGTVDLYFCGHDHNLQWLDERLCGAELVVSGAGAKTTALVGRGNQSLFETDSVEGFLYVVVQGAHLHAEFIDRNGNVLFTRDLTK